MSLLSWPFGRKKTEPAEAAAPAAHAPAAPQNVAISQVVRDSDFWSAFVPAGGGGLAVPSEDSAIAVSAVYACVGLISGALMSIPVDIHQRNADGSTQKLEDDDLWWVLNEEFSPRWMASVAWEYACKSLMLHGDAFIEIDRDVFGQVKALTPIHSSRITVAVTPDRKRLVYAIAPEDTDLRANISKFRVLDQDDMLHVPGFGFDGTRGLSVLRNGLRNAGASAIAMQEYAARFFANGARPDFTINTDKAISDATIEKLYAALSTFQGFSNAHRPMVLTGGLKVEPITMPLAEMQLLESRKFQLEEIARIFGVPPFMIGHTEKTTSWGSGVDSMGINFVRYTLRPYISRFQTEMNRKLFRRGRKVVRFDPQDLERADIKTMMEAIRIGLGRAGEQPVITPNEGRRMMRLPDMPDGNSLEPLTPSRPEQGA